MLKQVRKYLTSFGNKNMKLKHVGRILYNAYN